MNDAPLQAFAAPPRSAARATVDDASTSPGQLLPARRRTGCSVDRWMADLLNGKPRQAGCTTATHSSSRRHERRCVHGSLVNAASNATWSERRPVTHGHGDVHPLSHAAFPSDQQAATPQHQSRDRDTRDVVATHGASALHAANRCATARCDERSRDLAAIAAPARDNHRPTSRIRNIKQLP
jgi:hypothetical protein